MTRALQYYQKEPANMEKTTALNLRVNPDVKRRAKNVLSQLVIPISTTTDTYLKQVSIIS